MLENLQHAVLTIPNSDDFHRPFTLDARNIVGMVLAFVVGETCEYKTLFTWCFSIIHMCHHCTQVSALAPAAGVGGGAFFVPLFNIVVGFGMCDRQGAVWSACP